jgi:hypothetical protein
MLAFSLCTGQGQLRFATKVRNFQNLSPARAWNAASQALSQLRCCSARRGSVSVSASPRPMQQAPDGLPENPCCWRTSAPQELASIGQLDTVGRCLERDLVARSVLAYSWGIGLVAPLWACNINTAN